MSGSSCTVTRSPSTCRQSLAWGGVLSASCAMAAAAAPTFSSISDTSCQLPQTCESRCAQNWSSLHFPWYHFFLHTVKNYNTGSKLPRNSLATLPGTGVECSSGSLGPQVMVVEGRGVPPRGRSAVRGTQCEAPRQTAARVADLWRTAAPRCSAEVLFSHHVSVYPGTIITRLSAKIDTSE